MATSQNGWSTVDVGGTTPLPQITGRVRTGDVWTVFDYLAKEYHAKVEAIVKGHSWGYAARNVRNSTSVSNHASGTAVDFNAPRHPLGKRGTFSSSQVRAIRSILQRLKDMAGGVTVLRWGGDYKNRADEMHWEVVASSGVIAKVARAIKSGFVKTSERVGSETIQGLRNLYELEQRYKRSWKTPSTGEKARLAKQVEAQRAKISKDLARRIRDTVVADLAYLKAKHKDRKKTIHTYETILVPYAKFLARIKGV